MGMIPPRKTETKTETAEKPLLKGSKSQPAQETTPGPAAEVVSESTAVVAAAPAAGAVSTRVMGTPQDVIKQLFKEAFKVEWNTLHRLQATNGNIVDVEDNKRLIGPVVCMELMSYQDNWQISPGTDDKDDTQHVRYSDDGKFTNNGEPCGDYVSQLKEAGYNDAKMTQRCTLAGTLVLPGHVLDGTLVQIDLPQTSRQMFDRFRMQVSLDIARGLRTAESINPLKLECKLQTKGNNTWTVVGFGYGA